jgi:hypothetical protein
MEKRMDEFVVSVDIAIDGEDVWFRSMRELFMSIRAYSLAIGQNHPTVDGRILLDFSNVRRCDYENNGKNGETDYSEKFASAQEFDGYRPPEAEDIDMEEDDL